jgi:uncharacterized LabA/DUF88 family protein
MQFVDGENLTISSQRMLENSGYQIKESNQHRRNCFLWPGVHPNNNPFGRPEFSELAPIRSFYYTSCVGSEEALDEVRDQLWTLRFEPHVFKKDKQSQKTKGVDIALTKDMLSHAFRGNYEIARLFAGDGDYVPLVEEVKRLGKRVEVCFVGSATSPALNLATDVFKDITADVQNWGFDSKNSLQLGKGA